MYVLGPYTKSLAICPWLPSSFRTKRSHQMHLYCACDRQFPTILNVSHILAESTICFKP